MSKMIKRAMATALTVAMVFGSAGAVLADETAQEQTGTGTFEGVEPDLPDVAAITLPTAVSANGFFDYTADPLGLMRTYGDDDLKAKLPAQDKDTGIYFTDGDDKYTADSRALKVTNVNARAIDVTVTLEVDSDDYEDMTFASKGTWETTEKDNEIYLAAVEKGADPANTAAITDDGATLTIQIDGTPDNYEIKRTPAANGGAGSYAYAQKTGTLTWKEGEFYLTGAINKNAEWKDGTITVPDIKVTWDYAAHEDTPATPTDAAPSIATREYTLVSGTPINVSVSLGAGDLAATTVSSVMFGTANTLTNGYASYSNGVITLTANCVNNLLGRSGNSFNLVVHFDDDDNTSVTLTLNK